MKKIRTRYRSPIINAGPITPALAVNFLVASPALPTGWTFTRSDAISIYRGNTDGTFKQATANQPRWDYPLGGGNSKGMLMESTRTNLCTNNNVVCNATTNMTATGTATLSANVSDTTALTTFGANAICTAGVFEAAGGASGGTIIISGATGATGTFSAQITARNTVSSGASFGITPVPTVISITGTDYSTFKANNLTATNTTDTLVITLPAGVTIRFMFNQLEAGAQCSSIIKVAGATAVRSNENLSDQSISTRTYFSSTNMTVIAEFDFDDLLNTTGVQDLIVVSDTGNGTFTNLFRLYRLAATTRRKLNTQYFANSVNQGTGKAFGADVGSVDAAGQSFAAAVSWNDGSSATVSSGSDSYYINALTDQFTASSIVHLYIGNRAGVEQINGHVRKITFLKAYMTPEQIGPYLVTTGNWVVSTCGQSNMTDWFSAQSGSNNTGEITAKQNVDSFWTSTRNFFINGGTVGTSVIYYPATSDDTNYWLNTTTGAFGAPFRRWYSINTGCLNGTFKAIIDTCGESDAGNCTVQQFVDAMIAKFTIMRNLIGNVPVFLIPIGRNSSALDGYQTIREADWQLVGPQNPGWIYRCPERIDLALSDGLHMTDASAGIIADRATRKMLKVLGAGVSGGVDGPSITNVSRSGTTVTVTLTHDGGTDFTPTTAIAGFHYYNGPDYNSTENIITAAVRTNATTITLTLTSSSAGTLYYGKGSLSVDTIANLVKDNSTQALPLQTNKFTVT